MSHGTGMSRPARVGRGGAASAASVLLAAASHALGGGEVTGLAVIATAMLSLPLCVVLAGRVGSLWRLAVAVSASQFVYHWSFAGLGLSSGASGAGTATPAPLHAGHAIELGSFAPVLGPAGTADTAMWAAHAVAAVATIALLHRGERAVLALLRLVRRAAPRHAVALSVAPLPLARRAAPMESRLPSARTRLCSVSAISHRGPPAPAVS